MKELRYGAAAVLIAVTIWFVLWLDGAAITLDLAWEGLTVLGNAVLSWIGVGVMAQFGAIFAILAILALALIIVASPIYGLGLGAFLTVIVLILAAVQSVI